MGYARTHEQIRRARERRRANEVLYVADGYRELPDTREHPIVVDRQTADAITSGSAFELVTAGLAVAAAVIGLSGIGPLYMASLATLAVGFALLAQGGMLAARWNNAVRIEGSMRTEAMGIGTEVFGGLAGVALGVLALLGIAPTVMLPIAAVVLGVALLLGGPTQPELAEVARADAPGKRYRVTRRAVRTSGGVMVMAGLGALVLGTLALLVSTGPILTLSLAAMLCIGSALVLAGGAVTARFARRFS